MKKVMLTVSAFALVAMMAACGSSPEAKAKDLANKACDCMKMDDQTKMMECMTNLEKEYTEYAKDLHGEDSVKFEQAGREASEACMQEIMASK